MALPQQFGPYSLLKRLAKGGMGEIYLARTERINNFEKYYAVKKLLAKFATDEDVKGRFIDEALLGARLQHPNIVQVFDLGEMNDEVYMAAEFVDGFDLRRILRFCHEKKERIPLDIALFIVREVLSGLAYAHRQKDAEGKSINLIHRDISPQNVLVSFEGEVKIIDFGLAKSTQRSQETQANVLLGNFGYMSPEQARGLSLNHLTDIYSAGIVLFELVTRTKRFVDENPLRLLEMVGKPTMLVPSDRVPDVPQEIDFLYMKATAVEQKDRFDSAESFREAITDCLYHINPHASREELAKFLAYLFLGDKPPASVADEATNKSVAVQVQELHQWAAAFNKPKDQDKGDRSLSQFSDHAPQTGSHPLMRSCRLGEKLTHEQLTQKDPLTKEPNEPEVFGLERLDAELQNQDSSRRSSGDGENNYSMFELAQKEGSMESQTANEATQSGSEYPSSRRPSTSDIQTMEEEQRNSGVFANAEEPSAPQGAPLTLGAFATDDNSVGSRLKIENTSNFNEVQATEAHHPEPAVLSSAHESTETGQNPVAIPSSAEHLEPTETNIDVFSDPRGLERLRRDDSDSPPNSSKDGASVARTADTRSEEERLSDPAYRPPNPEVWLAKGEPAATAAPAENAEKSSSVMAVTTVVREEVETAGFKDESPKVIVDLPDEQSAIAWAEAIVNESNPAIPIPAKNDFEVSDVSESLIIDFEDSFEGDAAAPSKEEQPQAQGGEAGGVQSNRPLPPPERVPLPSSDVSSVFGNQPIPSDTPGIRPAAQPGSRRKKPVTEVTPASKKR